MLGEWSVLRLGLRATTGLDRRLFREEDLVCLRGLASGPCEGDAGWLHLSRPSGRMRLLRKSKCEQVDPGSGLNCLREVRGELAGSFSSVSVARAQQLHWLAWGRDLLTNRVAVTQ